MNTPICDFVKKYIQDNKIRLHMPGHKGKSYLGIEPFDITEIKGADALFEAEGIIKESENNASWLFRTGATFYSAEGSSLCIRAMLSLVVKYAFSKKRKPHIIAGRNAHKTFISSCALLDFTFSYIPEKDSPSYLSCNIDYDRIEEKIRLEDPVAIYITSPDYLGNIADINRLSKICESYNVLLIVDNAHGAYLNFISPNCHPIALGAHMCCDSAHKTLSVLTGGAYLHISKDAPEFFKQNAKSSMSLFASTSPSYLILQSLDIANALLASDYPSRIGDTIKKISILKRELSSHGFIDVSSEPLKLSIMTKPYGYTGYEFADELGKRGIECEFADPDFTVLMFTPDNDNIDMILDKIISIPRKNKLDVPPPKFTPPRRLMSVKEAVFSFSKTVPVSDAEGKILSSLNVGCPPAVPIVVCGEEINASSIALFESYGIKYCDIVIIE